MEEIPIAFSPRKHHVCLLENWRKLFLSNTFYEPIIALPPKSKYKYKVQRKEKYQYLYKKIPQQNTNTVHWCIKSSMYHDQEPSISDSQDWLVVWIFKYKWIMINIYKGWNKKKHDYISCIRKAMNEIPNLYSYPHQIKNRGKKKNRGKVL